MRWGKGAGFGLVGEVMAGVFRVVYIADDVHVAQVGEVDGVQPHAGEGGGTVGGDEHVRAC